MTVFAAFVHLINFLLPPMGLALISALMMKCCWWQRLAGLHWSRLVLAAFGANTACSIMGWMISGKDGSMLAYALMILANTLVLFGLGFMARTTISGKK